MRLAISLGVGADFPRALLAMALCLTGCETPTAWAQSSPHRADTGPTATRPPAQRAACTRLFDDYDRILTGAQACRVNADCTIVTTPLTRSEAGAATDRCLVPVAHTTVPALDAAAARIRRAHCALADVACNPLSFVPRCRANVCRTFDVSMIE